MDASHARILSILRRDGIAPSRPLRHSLVTDLVNYLSRRRVWNAHVQAKANASRPSAAAALAERSWPMFCHEMRDVVLAPHLLELALELYPLVREYFDREPPLLYSMNAFWTQPVEGAPAYQDTHSWHRDGDDRRQLVLFVFGTDVLRVEDGAHEYQRGTHQIADGALGRDFRVPPPSDTGTYLGPRGRAFLADTGGLHQGLRPKNGPRLLLWARWGVSDPPESYRWDKLEPVHRVELGDRYPADPRLQAAIRLVTC